MKITIYGLGADKGKKLGKQIKQHLLSRIAFETYQRLEILVGTLVQPEPFIEISDVCDFDGQAGEVASKFIEKKIPKTKLYKFTTFTCRLPRNSGFKKSSKAVSKCSKKLVFSCFELYEVLEK